MGEEESQNYITGTAHTYSILWLNGYFRTGHPSFLSKQTTKRMGLYISLPFSLSTSAVSVCALIIAQSSAVSPGHINFYNTHVHN